MNEWKQDLLGALAQIEDGNRKREDWYIDEDGQIKFKDKDEK